MKRFVSILCCLAMILVSNPFSASATEKSIDFTAAIFHSEGGISDEEKIYVLDSEEDCANFITNECTNGSSISTNVQNYLNYLPDDYFDSKALIAFSAIMPNPGYETKVFGLTEENGVITIELNYWVIDPRLSQPAVHDYFAILLEVEKDTLNGVTSFNLDKKRGKPDATACDFEAETVYVNDYTLELNGNYVLNNTEEQAEFFGLLGDYNPHIDEYFNALSADFYTTKSLVVVVSSTPGSYGYDFKARSLYKQGSVITVKLDWWEIDLDQAKPDEPGCYATMIEVDKSVLAGVNSIYVDRTDLRRNLVDNVGFTHGYYFPMDYSENSVPVVGDGDLFVLDTEEKAAGFAELNIGEEYLSFKVEDHLNTLPEGFFDDKAVLVSVIKTGCPNHKFMSANVNKVNGVLTIELNHTKEPFADPIEAYYIALIELDKDLLNDVDTYNVEKRDITDYENIEYKGHIFEDAVIEASGTTVIENASDLADYVANCDSSEFQQYANELTAKFFENKILVVAAHHDTLFTNIVYEMGSINGRCININANQSNRVRGVDNILFVYEIDKFYKDVDFYFYINETDLPGLFPDEDITINLTAMSYVMLKRNYFATFILDDIQLKNADVNKNGTIDPMDYMLVKRCYFGAYEQVDIPD